jgi:Putative F0F1-ATPase subunit Ca2+/Mg2+ transporter
MSARERHRRMVNPPAARDDVLSHGMSLIAAPVLFGLLGSWLDGLLGTGPVLLVVLAAFGVACSFGSAYYRYEYRMAKHDEGKPWNRRSERASGQQRSGVAT